MLATKERVRGNEHPSTLITAGHLANAYSGQGKHAEAVALYGEVLATQKRVLGDTHSSTLLTAGDLAIVYSNQGKYAEAEAL